VKIYTIAAGTPLYRIHWEVNEPVFYDRGPKGRFNPRAVPGAGACYLALDPLGSFVETMLHRDLVRGEDIEPRQLTSGAAVRDLQLFDGTARGNRFDLVVPLDLSLSAGPHAMTQDAAARLWGQVDGIVYWVSHDPGAMLAGVALFGEAGAAETSSVFAGAKTDDIPEELIDEAVGEFEYQIFDDAPVLPDFQ
jgi:RES domain